MSKTATKKTGDEATETPVEETPSPVPASDLMVVLTRIATGIERVIDLFEKSRPAYKEASEHKFVENERVEVLQPMQRDGAILPQGYIIEGYTGPLSGVKLAPRPRSRASK